VTLSQGGAECAASRWRCHPAGMAPAEHREVKAMSAFICGDMHINAIVTYAVEKRVSFYVAATRERRDITSFTAEEIGRILMDENVRSVVARYDATSPDYADEAKDAASDYKYKPFPTPLTPVEIIKACHCLEYQSCETEDWDSTLAWRILQDIKSAALHDLPGYDGAPWEITERSAKDLKHNGQIKLSSLMARRAVS
jgi:hypothetical protein